MVDGDVGSEFDGRASRYGDGCTGSSLSTDIAAEVIGGEVSHRRVVVCVLANIFVRGRLGAIVGQVFEDVWIYISIY